VAWSRARRGAYRVGRGKPLLYRLIARKTILTKYSIVCQTPGAEPYTVGPYSGTDLSQVLGITQADNMPEGSCGWIQELGNGYVQVGGQTQPAYIDFQPNGAKLVLSNEPKKDVQERLPDSPSGIEKKEPFDRDRYERLSQLPALLIEAGPYCDLIREARSVFVDGHFYACVAMCGISFERFQRDKAKPYGGKREHKIQRIRGILIEHKVLKSGTLKLCKSMANLRNEYAHGNGLNPKGDALKALHWMHCFIDNETNLMRNYVIVNGILSRKRAETT